MRRHWLVLFFPAFLFSQTAQPPEPPEEDISPTTVREYTFNPLQAVKELRVGNFYLKKGSYRAAVRRFEEAVKWDPNAGEAWLRLGEAHSKLREPEAAREAWKKYLNIQPEGKEAEAVRKKLSRT